MRMTGEKLIARAHAIGRAPQRRKGVDEAYLCFLAKRGIGSEHDGVFEGRQRARRIAEVVQPQSPELERCERCMTIGTVAQTERVERLGRVA